jgi:hypothetical protein
LVAETKKRREDMRGKKGKGEGRGEDRGHSICTSWEFTLGIEKFIVPSHCQRLWWTEKRRK